MASVTNDNARKYRYMGQEHEEELEQKKVFTLRDKIFKQCLERQLNVSGSLEEQINKKEFVQATTEESITKITSGLLSNREFQNVEKEFKVDEILRASGLSKAEIQFLINEESGNSSLEAPYARDLRLQEIAKKLSKRQELLENYTNEPEQFSGAIPLNRHTFEEECNTVPLTNAADKLTACLVRLEPHKDERFPADHPINHIKELAEEIFPSGNIDDDDTTAQKKRKISEDTSVLSEKRKKIETVKFKYVKEKPKTFWDMKEIPKVITDSGFPNLNKSEIDIGTKPLSPQKNRNKKCSVDKTKSFVLSLDPSDLVPLEEICSNKKTLQEIKSMEQFKNYNAGEPSKTLYFKNLPHKICSKDFVSIIGHFDSNQGPKNIYRILDGRMRGQAFVTFQDVATASKALNTCNGYILHGKPMVIAYGKK